MKKLSPSMPQEELSDTAKKENVRKAFAVALSNGSTHMIMVRDTYCRTEEPRYAANIVNARVLAHRAHCECDKIVVGIYDTNIDIEQQLAVFRPWNLEPAGTL